MGLFNLNVIGAYIISIFLLGLLIRRPSLREGEGRLRAVPLWLHFVLILFLASLALHQSTDFLSFLPIVTIPNVFLAGFTLWIHEAGHLYFSWDGQVLHSFGGTLNEILFSCIPALICHFRNCTLLRSIFLFWLGYNCFGISKYMSDARAEALPLVGGGTHDWKIIFSELGLLEWDTMLGTCVFVFGVILVVASLSLYLVFLQRPAISEDR